MKLIRAFRDDRLLLVLFAILVVAAWTPLFLTPFLPFSDLHNNSSMASLLWNAARGNGTVGYHYHVNWFPVPYWTAYLFMAAVNAVSNTLIAAKAIVALNLLLLPLAVMRLLIALGRSPRLALWAFVLSWQYNIYHGWVTFLLGMALALFALALLIEVRSLRDALWMWPLSALVALSHLQALALLAVAGIAVTLVARPFWRRSALNAVALSGGLVGVAPWLGKLLTNKASSLTKVPFAADWHTPADKASRLFEFTIDNWPKEPVTYAPALAFAFMIVGPVLMGSLPQLRSTLTHSATHRPSSTGTGAAWAVMLSCLAMFAFMPIGVREPVFQWHNYPRYAPFIFLTALLIPRPDLRGTRALWLLVGVGVALAMDLTVARQFMRFAVDARPFLQIIASVEPGARVLPIINIETNPHCKVNPFNQFHAYIAGMRQGYDPYMFDNGSVPLLYFRHLPVPRWNGSAGTGVADRLDLKDHARSYDYILIQGLAQDPLGPHGRLEGRPGIKLVTESGQWRLYSVTRSAIQ